MKTRLGAKDILFPVPAALVVTGTGNNSNIITIAWIGIVGSNPPAIGISLHKNRYSLPLLRKTGEFTVNIPRKSDYIKVDYCGLASGKKVNKFKDTGFTKIDGSKVKVPIIKDCPVNIECEIIKELKITDWVLVIGEILEISIDSDKISHDGKVSIEKIDPLVYIPTIREYWSIGQKLGNSFDVGHDYKRTLKTTKK